jgi:hypothetical protein
MMADIPAFPTEPNTQPGFYQHHGMSLRDYFAGRFLAGVSANPEMLNRREDQDMATWSYGEDGWSMTCFGKDMATIAYIVADAMLAARNPQEGE